MPQINIHGAGKPSARAGANAAYSATTKTPFSTTEQNPSGSNIREWQRLAKIEELSQLNE